MCNEALCASLYYTTVSCFRPGEVTSIVHYLAPGAECRMVTMAPHRSEQLSN